MISPRPSWSSVQGLTQSQISPAELPVSHRQLRKHLPWKAALQRRHKVSSVHHSMVPQQKGGGGGGAWVGNSLLPFIRAEVRLDMLVSISGKTSSPGPAVIVCSWREHHVPRIDNLGARVSAKFTLIIILIESGGKYFTSLKHRRTCRILLNENLWKWALPIYSERKLWKRLPQFYNVAKLQLCSGGKHYSVHEQGPVHFLCFNTAIFFTNWRKN